MPWLDSACLICANSISVNQFVCGPCLTRTPHFDRTQALFRYEDPIRKMITQLKFHEQLRFAYLCGNLLAQKMQGSAKLPDVIIPVPLHKKRLRERGFNQALEIGRHIQKQLQIPLNYHSLIRHKATEPQSQLPAKQRDHNIKQAFHLKRTIPAQHIVLLDDVVTTGSTVNEIAHTLKKQQNCFIEVWCIAKTRIG